MTISITYPISLPANPAPVSSDITMDSAAALTESPFDFSQQAFLHAGDRWLLNAKWPPMNRATFEPFAAAFGQLFGRYGTFLFGDFDGRNPRGVGTGTPEVNGANQVGNNLITNGWTDSVTGILKAGDYIQLGTGETQRLHKVLQDASSDGSGNATLLIWPRLRYSPASGASIVLVNTMTQFRMDAPFKWNANEVPTYGFEITATEAL
jgi:hypothetical protein